VDEEGIAKDVARSFGRSHIYRRTDNALRICDKMMHSILTKISRVLSR